MLVECRNNFLKFIKILNCRYLDCGFCATPLNVLKKYVVKHKKIFGCAAKKDELCSANLKQSFLP